VSERVSEKRFKGRWERRRERRREGTWRKSGGIVEGRWGVYIAML
jgi:hypothetical protein